MLLNRSYSACNKIPQKKQIFIQCRKFSTNSNKYQSSYTFDEFDFLRRLGLQKEGNPGACIGGEWRARGETVDTYNPSTGKAVASVTLPTIEDYHEGVKKAKEAEYEWRNTPAPTRAGIVKEIGDALREYQEDLGKVNTLQMGKIIPEGTGEVQEFIDICDLATGLGRQLEGKVLQSERKNHALYEIYNPIGSVGIITTYNFPVAVYGWNAANALTCGNSTVWKGAPSVPLVTIATGKIVQQVLRDNKVNPAVATIFCGGAEIGEAMTHDKNLEMISFTGSVQTGQKIRQVVNDRMGRTLLELGGNNAIIVSEDANIELAVRSSLFSCAGTAGQRCTTTRRLILHESIYDQFVSKLKNAYSKLTIGDPLKDEGVLYGPVHGQNTVDIFKDAVKKAQEQGGRILYGGNVIEREGYFVEPTIIEISHDAPIVMEETFAPIVYCIKYSGDVSNAIQLNNCVSQGLSSSLFSTDISKIFEWIGPNGSDCGIVNVNIPTSGAEISGAFGGNKATGEGRECGSDAWKNYCRRSTVTINYGKELPLAQGVKFDTD